MMDLATIRDLSEQAAKRAKRERKLPYIMPSGHRIMFAKGQQAPASIPFFGDYVPPGWEQTEDEPLFVDTSGFGGPGEPALSQSNFYRVIAADPEGLGYAMTEHGQFQCYVARYRKTLPPRKPAAPSC